MARLTRGLGRGGMGQSIALVPGEVELGFGVAGPIAGLPNDTNSTNDTNTP